MKSQSLAFLLGACLAVAAPCACAQDKGVSDTTLSPQTYVKMHNNGDGTYSPEVVVGDGSGNVAPPGTSGSPVYVLSANPATIKPSFEQTVSASAAALATQTGYANGFFVKALTTNTGTVCVGDSTVNLTTACYPLKPGEAVSYGVTTTAVVYVVDSTITDQVAVAGN